MSARTFEEWRESRHMNGIYTGDLEAAWNAGTESARAAIAELIAAAKDAADDLESEIRERPPIERDMDTVRRLRAALAAVGGEVSGE